MNVSQSDQPTALRTHGYGVESTSNLAEVGLKRKMALHTLRRRVLAVAGSLRAMSQRPKPTVADRWMSETFARVGSALAAPLDLQRKGGLDC